MRTITVVDHDPSWPAVFQTLRASVWPAVRDIAVAIEHVGSTSVPGLAAKPVIDLDVVLRPGKDVPTAVERLVTLGYAHLGDLGVDGREAFAPPPGSLAHNLYVCPPDSPGLANHLALRDHLRRHPELASAYGALKKRLAGTFTHDIDGYVAAKTAFIVGVLREAGLPEDLLARIERANRRPTPGRGRRAGRPTPVGTRRDRCGARGLGCACGCPLRETLRQAPTACQVCFACRL